MLLYIISVIYVISFVYYEVFITMRIESSLPNGYGSTRTNVNVLLLIYALFVLAHFTLVVTYALSGGDVVNTLLMLAQSLVLSWVGLTFIGRWQYLLQVMRNATSNKSGTICYEYKRGHEMYAVYVDRDTLSRVHLNRLYKTLPDKEKRKLNTINFILTTVFLVTFLGYNLRNTYL